MTRESAWPVFVPVFDPARAGKVRQGAEDAGAAGAMRPVRCPRRVQTPPCPAAGPVRLQGPVPQGPLCRRVLVTRRCRARGSDCGRRRLAGREARRVSAPAHETARAGTARGSAGGSGTDVNCAEFDAPGSTASESAAAADRASARMAAVASHGPAYVRVTRGRASRAGRRGRGPPPATAPAAPTGIPTPPTPPLRCCARSPAARARGLAR
jgi:hypothetical protein